MQRWFPVILLALLIFGLDLRIATHVGFISDDWDLIQRASVSSYWLPLEKHHYSLLINLLFIGVAKGVINAFSIHFIALLFHFLNGLMVYLTVREVFQYGRIKSWIPAFLFAMNPAGLEAIAWCCAIGYVVCSFWMLLGLYLYLKFLKSKDSSRKYFTLLSLLGVQLCAFLSWDWAITFFPIILATASFYERRKGVFFTRLRFLIPLAIFWIAILIFKKIMLFEFGYRINSFEQIAKNIVVSPFLGLFPQFTKSFYASKEGIFLALVTFGAVVFTSLRLRQALLMTSFFFLFLSPQIFMGHPQSRYFYLPMFALYAVLLVFWDRVIKRSAIPTLASFAWLPFLCLHFYWAYQRVHLWEGAYAQAQALEIQFTKIARGESKKLLLVNLPDRYGPEGMIWLPFVWRCGYEHFSFSFDQVATPESSRLLADQNIHLMQREEIAAKYPEHASYEVVSTKNCQFEIKALGR